MKIESITLQNYGTFYGPHSFQFDKRGLVLVLGENLDEPRLKSNGAGKSTVFDALDWCLFGDIPRGDHVDSIVNEDAGSMTKVQVHLVDDDGTAYTVARWRGVKGAQTVKPNGCALFRGPDDLTALDDAETQRLIDRVLGVDREVFHALVLHAQTDTWNFASAPDVERIKILTKVLQLGQIDEWLERAKAKAKTVDERIQRLTGELSVLTGQHAELSKLDYTAQTAEWDANNATQIAEAQRSAQVAMQSAKELRESIPDEKDLEVRYVRLKASEPPRPTMPPAPGAPVRPSPPAAPDKSGLAQGFAEARKSIATATADIEVKRRQVEKLLRDAETFERQKQGVCGECRQPIDPAHVAAEVAKLRGLARQIEESIGPVEASLRQWRDYEATLEQQSRAFDHQHAQALAAYQAELVQLDQRYHEAIAAHRVEVQRLEAAYSVEASAHAAEAAKLRHELDGIAAKRQLLHQANMLVEQERKRVEALEAQENPWTRKAVELRHRLADLDQAIHRDQEDLEAQRDAARYVDFWVQGLGPKGLKNFILDARVQELTDAANHWMRLIYGGTSWVRFETQTMGRSTGKLANKLNIRCFRYMPDGTVRERNFKSLSGGEKQRTSLAIDMGLSRLIASRATKRYDLLVLDEVFKHLDSAGREAVVDMLCQLQAEKSSIFVVDHDAEFQGAFEHRVVVRKQGGRSIILDGIPNDQDVGRGVPQETGEAVQKAVPRRRPISRTPVVGRPGG